jgi:hypothetical protein
VRVLCTCAGVCAGVCVKEIDVGQQRKVRATAVKKEGMVYDAM